MINIKKEVLELTKKLLEKAGFEVVDLHESDFKEEMTKKIPSLVIIDQNFESQFVDVQEELDIERLKQLLDFHPETKVIYPCKKDKIFKTAMIQDFLKTRKTIPLEKDGFKIKKSIVQKYNRFLQNLQNF